jgi:hypothetical protein
MAKTPENYGTIEYLQELDEILGNLDGVRKHLGKFDRKERFTISRAMESLRDLKRRAAKHGLSLGLLSEEDL